MNYIAHKPYDMQKARAIINAIAKEYGMHPDFVKEKSNEEFPVSLRYSIANLMTEVYKVNISMTEISKLLGKKTHAVLYHGFKNVKNYMENNDKKFLEVYNKCLEACQKAGLETFVATTMTENEKLLHDFHQFIDDNKFNHLDLTLKIKLFLKQNYEN